MKLFPNPENNEWIDKYNSLVIETKSHEQENIEHKKFQKKRNDKDSNSWNAQSIGIHHIIPKKVDPSLENDKENLLYVSFENHCNLHYYLWKSDPKYAAHFWFLLLAARKMKLWDLPGGEEEYKQIAKDVALSRKKK